MPLPWGYIRRHLAKVWGIAPWEVDSVPFFEVDAELTMSALEAKYSKRQG